MSAHTPGPWTRLIAAAPDLLAALRELANAAEDCATSDPDMPSHASTGEAFELALSRARAAIAKAAGQA